MTRRRATLEQIAYGEGTTPTERLRALELLRELEPVERPSETERALRLAMEIPEAEMDRELDQIIAPVIIDAVETGADTYPVTRDLLRRLAERWAAELADLTRIEQEIERRAEERATALYLDSGWRSLRDALKVTKTAPDGTGALDGTDEPSDPPPAARTPPIVPGGIDPGAGWAPRSRGRSQR